MTPPPLPPGGGAFPDPTRSFFEILGVGPGASGDELNAAFRALSRKFHPDRFATQGEESQAEALATSALLNDAYRTLKDLFLRAEYLLKTTRGWKPDDARGFRPPANLFAEVMEVQEAVEAFSEGDSSQKDALLSARAEFSARYDALETELRALFARYDSGETDTALDEVTQIAAIRGYFKRVVTNVDAALAR